MEVLKNFLIGLIVVIASLVLFIIIGLTWPLLSLLGSLFLSIVAAIAFIVLIFYIIVFIGYLVRTLIFKRIIKDAE